MTDEMAFTLSTVFGIFTAGWWAMQIAEYDPEVKPEYLAQIGVAWLVGFAVALSAMKIVAS
jgi:uncharacterized membrane protein YwzB